MAEKKAKKETIKKESPTSGDFKNVTKHNVYTSAGRCGAGEVVNIPFSEGEITKGLELV